MNTVTILLVLPALIAIQSGQTESGLLNEPILKPHLLWHLNTGRIERSENETVEDDFSLENCGQSDLIKIRSLSVTPAPIEIPGSLTVNFDGILQKNITSPLQVKLVIKKRILVWVPVFFTTYPDVCALIPPDCPEQITKANLPCKCPITEGEYHAESLTFSIPKIGLPSFLAMGRYSVEVKGYSEGNQLFCYNVKFSLKIK